MPTNLTFLRELQGSQHQKSGRGTQKTTVTRRLLAKGCREPVALAELVVLPDLPRLHSLRAEGGLVEEKIAYAIYKKQW